MAEENLLYFGLNYNELIGAKKNLLSAEMDLINIIKIIRNYKLIRGEELKLKLQLHKSVKKLNTEVKKTISLLPFSKIPQKIEKEVSGIKKIDIAKRKTDGDLESQLREIQEKLRAIS
jgi:hypothetical protein